MCTSTGPHFADGATVPRRCTTCTWAWVRLGWLRRLADGGHFAVAPSVAEAMEAGFLPAPDEDQADMFTPSELRLYLHVQDHRLLTRDILGYPSLFGNILG